MTGRAHFYMIVNLSEVRRFVFLVLGLGQQGRLTTTLIGVCSLIFVLQPRFQVRALSFGIRGVHQIISIILDVLDDPKT